MNKIYNNPTVKQVIFQILFPNLFFIENKIPDIQLSILSEFPESALLVRYPITTVMGNKPMSQQELENDAFGQKIWEFKNTNGFELHLTSNSLTILSKLHKTYNNEGSDYRFREIIQFVLEAFGKNINLPIVNRIGLRYSDECPVSEITTDKYSDYFDTAYNLKKNPIEYVDEMRLYLIKNIADCKIIYQEQYVPQNNPEVVILDFDGFKQNIAFKDCLDVTDRLHDLISDEYEKTIKDPLRRFMEGVSS